MTELRGLRTYIYECTECESGKFERIVRYPERDEQNCTECDSLLVRRPCGCVTNTRISRTFVDGTDRGDTYRKLKEAAKIEQESFDLPTSERGEHNQEIHKLKKVKK